MIAGGPIFITSEWPVFPVAAVHSVLPALRGLDRAFQAQIDANTGDPSDGVAGSYLIKTIELASLRDQRLFQRYPFRRELGFRLLAKLLNWLKDGAPERRARVITRLATGYAFGHLSRAWSPSDTHFSQSPSACG